MARQLETNIVIGGTASPSLNRAFQTAQRNAEATSKSMEGLGGVVKKVGGIIAAAFAVDTVVAFTKDCVEGYADIVQSETKLSTIMKQRMNATDAQVQQIISLADAQEKLGVVDAESAKFGAQQLATFLNSSDSLKTLIPAMEDLAVQQNGVNVTSDNMVSLGNLMGKAMMGQTGALTKVGISFNAAQEEVLKYGNEQQKAAMLAKVIKDNVGEMNKAITNTPQGQIKQMNNAFGQVKDSIGQAVTDLSARFAPKIQEIIPKIAGISEKVIPLFNNIGNGIQWCIDNSSSLIGVLNGIGLAIIAVTTAQLAYNGVVQASMIISALSKAWETAAIALTWLREGQSLATVAQILFNTALTANPIGVVIAAVAALTAGFIYLWKTSEGFRNFFLGLWDSISGVATKIGNFFSGLFGSKTVDVKTNTPKIPEFATGGTLTSPMMAIVGDAPETIVPHGNTPRNRALLNEAAAGVGASIGGSINVTFAPVIQGGGGDVKQQLVSAEEEFERRMDAYFAKNRRLGYGV